MASSKNVKRMVREMQELTGRSYTDCLNQLAQDGEIHQIVKPDGTKEWRIVPLDEKPPA